MNNQNEESKHFNKMVLSTDMRLFMQDNIALFFPPKRRREINFRTQYADNKRSDDMVGKIDVFPQPDGAGELSTQAD